MKTEIVYTRKLGSPKGPFRLTNVVIREIISHEEFLGNIITEETTYRFKKDSQGIYNPTPV